MTKKPCSIIVFPSQFAGRILEALSALPLLPRCPNCGSEAIHRDVTLAYDDEVVKLQLSMCPRCSQEVEQVNSPAGRKVA